MAVAPTTDAQIERRLSTQRQMAIRFSYIAVLFAVVCLALILSSDVAATRLAKVEMFLCTLFAGFISPVGFYYGAGAYMSRK